jgi:uncharacterized OB-fold protein
MRADEPTFLLPDLDDDSRGFWEGCAQGELRVQRCDECGRRRFPPRPMCPACQSFRMTWEAVSGAGRVWSHVVAHPPLLPPYGDHAPYNVVVVALDEDPGLRMVGNLVDGPGARLDSVDPDTISIGEPVQVVFDRLTDAVTLPRWVRPASGG